MQAQWFSLLLSAALLWSVQSVTAQAPALPPGLGGREEEDATGSTNGRSATHDTQPELPSGLGPSTNGDGDGEPALPGGLGDEQLPEQQVPSADKDAAKGPLETAKQTLRRHQIYGFIDTRWGWRVVNDPYQDNMSIGEIRLQLEHARQVGPTRLNLKTDFLYDREYDHHDIHLETGNGWLDIREAAISFTPHSIIDVKIGRQVLTWGTGDLVFVNDLFPKDWKSFFIGRDSEYLKAPSDAIKVSIFPDTLPNLDLVYTPRFDADRHIDGSRLSFWNPLLQRRSGQDNIIHTDTPDDWFTDDEFAARIYTNVKTFELAGYVYYGYWKSPNGVAPASGQFTFPDLAVYGASVRGPMFNGIGYAETGYYDSRDDRNGDDSSIANSEFHFLLGYEQEILPDLTATIQYYVRQMMDHEDYLDSLPPGARSVDETRHSFTVRLRQLLLQQTLEINIFTRFSPSADDGYIRPVINYKVTDDWALEAGGNLFYGKERQTFLGQFDSNDNVYVATRFSF